MVVNRMVLAAALACTMAGPVGAQVQSSMVKGALQEGYLGLYPAHDFRLADGKCTDCAALKQGLWYFRDDLLALPKPGLPQAGYSATLERQEDIRAWMKSDAANALAYPPLVWLGAPQVADAVTLAADGKRIATADGSALDFRVVPKIATNRSYYDASSVAYFAGRPLRVRGTLEEASGDGTGKQTGKPQFVARSIWPKDFAIDAQKLALQPMAGTDDLKTFVRAGQGGAKSAYATRLIWERHPGVARHWQYRPIIGVMLNGAQGDDDEAYGGHFAIATGRFGADGEWSDWMVNNFYNLDSVSEKGIIASMVPMDNYLMDLNSGQQYYRPSYMLVAVLNNPRTAIAYQGAVERTYNHFYRHDFVYQHAAANCAGISLDVFKALGWNIPERGPTGWGHAILGYGYLAAKDGSLNSGRKIYDYLTEETTHLLPAVAFDAAGQDLLALVGELPARKLSEFENQLASDVDALVLVRIPQVPSSRAFGSNPVFSFDEYMERAPKNHADWKIVPVDARPFPSELREGQALQQQSVSAVPLPIAGIATMFVVCPVLLSRKRKRRRAENLPRD